MNRSMMNALSIIATLSAQQALAATVANDWKAQIAEDPRQLTLQADMIAEGDMTGDGIKDIAAVATYQKSANDELPTPVLFVFQGTPSGSYLKSVESEGAVCAGCGGVNGDTFVGTPSVNAKGQLVLNYWGGSAARWNVNIKFRYNALTREFDAIGYTEDVYNSANDDGRVASSDVASEDANLITGKMFRTYGSGRKVTCKVNRKWRGLTLSGFNYERSYENYGELAARNSCRTVR